MKVRTWLVVSALALLATSCNTTPLDNVWPGCMTCRPCPVPAAPVEIVEPMAEVVPEAAVPWEVRIDESISPIVDCNPIKTQHTLVATVYDQSGNPMPGQRVEWILSRYDGAVGDIIAHDDQYGAGSIAPIQNARVTNAGNKITNRLVMSVTNYGPELIDAGNNYPYESVDGARLPDFTVGRGQSWVTITSTREGVTDIICFVPGIRDGTKHKIFAKKIWADFNVQFPESAVNTLPDNTHEFGVRVTRSDGSGIPGQKVEAELLDGPTATLQGANNGLAQAMSDANGVARFVLRNTGGESGVNRVKFTAYGNFYGETCPRSAIVTKEWRKVSLEVNCSMPPTASLGRTFDKTITVTNTGDAPAEAVMLNDSPGGGLAFAGNETFPMDLGTLQPGETATRTIQMVGNSAGNLTNSVSVRTANASAQNSCSIEIVQGKLEITKVCEPAKIAAGGNVNFVVTVSNTGKGPLENVVVTDDYPNGITPTSQNSTTLGVLAPGESQEVVFGGVAPEAGTYTNVARATADGAPEVKAQCTLTVVKCKLNLELVGPESIYYGEPANFTLKIVNEGDGDASGCVVRVSYGGCLGGGFEDFQIGPLAPNETWTKDWSRVAQSVGPCTITADSNCGASCSMRGDAEVRVTGLTALQVEMVDKALDGSEEGIFAVGETFSYRLRIENDVGTESTPEMYVEWKLPPELEFISGRSLDGSIEVTGSGTAGKSDKFVLPVSGAQDFEIQVRAVSAPPSGLVKTVAVVWRSQDNAELASETESTTVKK